MPADDGGRLTRADRALLGVLYAPVAPVGLAVAGAWLAMPLAGTAGAGPAALLGLAAGAAVDVAVLRRWVARGFRAPAPMLVGVYAFYSFVTFAVFMGMPVPQLALGLVAGAFAGRGRRDVGRTRALTVAAAGTLTAVAAGLAVGNPSTAYDAERLLGGLGTTLPVTTPMIVAAVVVGLPLLVAAQWVVTTAGARLGARRAAPAARGRRVAQWSSAPASATSSRASSAETTSTVFVA